MLAWLEGRNQFDFRLCPRDKLTNVESNLRQATDTRRKIARELHLDDDATDADLLLKLKDMKQSSDKDRQRAADVERQLSGLRAKISALEDEKQALDRQCVQLAFRVRQLNHQVLSQSRRAEKFTGNVQPAPLLSDRQTRGYVSRFIVLNYYRRAEATSLFIYLVQFQNDNIQY